MKRILNVLLSAFFVLFLFTGCGGKQSSDDRLKIVCTIFPQYDFVRQIAGDSVDLQMLLPYGMESHDYRLENLTAKDMETVMNADIFIYVGGESDRTWVNELKSTVGGANVRWLALSDMTETLCIEEHDHEHGNGHTHEHDGEEIDEHIWTSPLRVIDVVEKICDVLTELDPENAELYENGTEKFKSELSELDDGFRALNGMNGETVVFADRFPFRYLFEDYSIAYAAAFTGCGEGADPSALQIVSLCNIARECETDTVFYMESSNSAYAETVAGTVGADCKMLHSCHSVTKAEFKSGATYISLMKKNLEILTETVK